MNSKATEFLSYLDTQESSTLKFPTLGLNAFYDFQCLEKPLGTPPTPQQLRIRYVRT